MTDLSIQLGSLTLKNPVVVASGTFGSSDEYASFVDVNRLGAVITKSITVEARTGNKPPRICETAAGMLNAIGLENKGIEHFIEKSVRYFEDKKTVLIVSIAGNVIDEYETLARRLARESRVDALEINISCPNVKKGGVAFLKDGGASQEIVKRVKSVFSKPVFVKVSSEAYDVIDLVGKVRDAGVDGVSLINTIKGMAVSLEKRKPILGNITGGLSGPAIKPVALRYLYEVKQAFSLPVIAGGGIMTVRDALEFLLVGAQAIAVGTANFTNPTASMDIVEGIQAYCKKENIKTISEFIGTLRTGN